MNSRGRCRTGKVAYKDRIAALLALSDTMRETTGRRQEIRAYACSECGGWHLSSRLAYVAPRLESGRPARRTYDTPRLSGPPKPADPEPPVVGG